MNFTEKLDVLMKERGLNKNTLSKACEIPYTTIDGWYKKGASDMKLSTLKKLTTYFDLSLDYWLAGDEDEETKKAPAPEGTREKEHILLDETNDLLVELGYIRKGQQLSDADLAFLTHIIGLLDAWFLGDKA